ncbi:hypothetical protein BpHYR1_031158 [Brachionus plicatilis]|uniref:Uncharacterized protein n=1 Tax=Brachionus plicatilis TaxID=10195 RepID=A0A3M7P8K2_BRAPC|nr:hypothetical protein BpHYR1_031158 [Brachionus plicatilis]
MLFFWKYELINSSLRNAERLARFILVIFHKSPESAILKKLKKFNIPSLFLFHVRGTGHIICDKLATYDYRPYILTF